MKTFRFLFIALALMLSKNASAHDFVVDGIYYNIISSSDLTVAVTCQGRWPETYSNEYSGSIVIPEKVTYDSKEYFITSIGGGAFGECSGLTSVTIPNSVTSIGGGAFEGCSALTSVNIPNSVTSIGGSAFSGCSGLTSVTIPNSVTSIGDYAFYECSGLKNLTIGNSVTSIGDYAFYECSGLTSIDIPNSVTSIGGSAFSGCSGLTSVTIPNSVTSIGDYAFCECSGLTSIDIPNSVTSIRERAFSGCKGLTSVTIPNSVTSIGDYAFCECSGLTSIDIPNSVTSIRERAFSGCKGLTSVTIPNSVTSIGELAFSGCSGLTAVHITDLSAWCKIKFDDDFSGVYRNFTCNPTYYAHHLYLNGEEITNLVIPDDITRIRDAAFYGCFGLTSVTIPNSVTSIGCGAFEGCSALTSVTIPNSVTSIGCYAFFSCKGLTSVTIGNSVETIGHLAFYNCSGLTAVYITDLSAWCKINFRIDGLDDRYYFFSNPIYYAHHLYLNGEEIKNLVIPDDITSIEDAAFKDCSGLTSVTIPNSVTSIGNYAFYDCSGLTSVTIPNSVTSIGNGAFCNCSGLTSVTIPNSVTRIGERAFSGCKGLTSVTIGNSVGSIGYYAFYNCSGLTAVHINDLSAWCKIDFVNLGMGTSYDFDFFSNPICYAHHLYLNGEEIKNLVIPDDITSIRKAAFKDCSSLTSVTIPNSVTSIGERTFDGCSSLTNINCQAATPPEVYSKYTFSNKIYTKATLNVPKGCADKYKAANIWKQFTNMTVGGSELDQCAAPVIIYADGKLQFACETAGAECKYTLTAKDIQTAFITASNNSVDLTACYEITAYAVAEGYKNSEKVTATLYWIDGSDVSTNINQTEMRGVMATCSGGIITVSGLSDGETVMFYDANGALLYTGTAQNGRITYAPSTSGVIIVKIGTTSIKVVK